MENLNIEPSQINSLPPDPENYQEKPVTHKASKLRQKVIISIVAILIFCGTVYGSFQYFIGSNPTTITSASPHPNKFPLSTVIPTNNQTADKPETTKSVNSVVINSTPTPTPTSIPKPSLQPTATPTTFDLSTNNATTIIKRYYNSGDGRGFVTQSPSSYANDGPVFDELIQLWDTQIELCTKIKTTQVIYGYNINYLPIIDGQEQKQQLVGSINLPANQEYEMCSKQTNDAIGLHKFQIKFNPYQNYPESNYSNNLVEANYTILADNKPPTFVIYGPNSKPEGTCFHVNDVSDNVSLFSEIKFSYKFDGNDYANLIEFACFPTNDGNTHTVTIKAADKRNNSTENSRTFTVN